MTTLPLSPHHAFLSGVMTEAWKLARKAAVETGRTAFFHLPHSLRYAWVIMRSVAAAKAARAESLARQAALDLALADRATVRPAHLPRPLTRAGRGIPAVLRHTQGARR